MESCSSILYKSFGGKSSILLRQRLPFGLAAICIILIQVVEKASLVGIDTRALAYKRGKLRQLSKEK